MVRFGKLDANQVVIISVDRAANKTYPQDITVDKMPTLTTKNHYLFVISLGDLEPRCLKHCLGVFFLSGLSS
jgi:hypothetical protein